MCGYQVGRWRASLTSSSVAAARSAWIQPWCATALPTVQTAQTREAAARWAARRPTTAAAPRAATARHRERWGPCISQLCVRLKLKVCPPNQRLKMSNWKTILDKQAVCWSCRLFYVLWLTLKVRSLTVAELLNMWFFLCSVVAVQQGSGSWRTGWPVPILMSVRAQLCAVSCASTVQAHTNVTVTQATSWRQADTTARSKVTSFSRPQNCLWRGGIRETQWGTHVDLFHGSHIGMELAVNPGINNEIKVLLLYCSVAERNLNYYHWWHVSYFMSKWLLCKRSFAN